MDFRRLWVADAISQLGTRMTFLAAPLLAVLYLHATAFEVALVRTFQSLGGVLFGLAAGAWVDRMRCRPVLLTTDLGRAAVMLTVPVAAWFGVLALWQLYAVMAVIGVLTVFFDIAHQSYLPRLLPPDALTGANAKLAANRSVAALAGAGAGGFLVQLLTAPFVFVLDALSMVWSAAWLRSIRHREPAVARAPDRHLGREVAEGVRFVWRQPLLRPIAANVATTVLCQSAGIAVSVVFLVRDIGLSAGVIGVLGTIGLVGALLSAALAQRLIRWLGEARALVAAGFALGPAFLVQAFTTPGWGLTWWVAGTAVASFCLVLMNVVQVTVRQVVCPAPLLGRVGATMEFVLSAATPVGSVLGGVLATVAGTRETLLWSGALACLGVGWLVASPLRRMRALPGTVGADR
jgi:MFS family permease